MQYKVGSWKIVRLPRNDDESGSLFFFQTGREINFEFRRLYCISNVPLGTTRGNHAHKNLSQAIIAIGGKLEIKLFNSFREETVILNPLEEVLLIEGVVWRELKFLNSDTVCVVAASSVFDESDYIRSFEEFRQITERQKIDNPFL